MIRRYAKLMQFAKFVADWIFSNDPERDFDFFSEVACRKLSEIGIVEGTRDEWILKKGRK